MSSQPRMYTDLADWWPILSRPADYAEEAALFTQAIRSRIPDARTLLELGSGGGNNASHLKRHFTMILVDLSPGMLAVSQRLNPELEHHQGDMCTFRLREGGVPQTFDAVFIHDAVSYLTSEEELRRAMETAAFHTRPGGVLLVVPDCTRESFRPTTKSGGHDGKDVAPEIAGADPVLSRRSLRYLEWSYDPDPSDTHYVTDFAFLLREGPDHARCVYNRHLCGVFPRATWLRLLAETGFRAEGLPLAHSELEPGAWEAFVGVRDG